MHYRKLTERDLLIYLSDINSCYDTNTLVFDSQNYLINHSLSKFLR